MKKPKIRANNILKRFNQACEKIQEKLLGNQNIRVKFIAKPKFRKLNRAADYKAKERIVKETGLNKILLGVRRNI